MFKKIALISTVSLLSACTTLSSEDDLSNAVESVKNNPTYFEVTGQKIEPDNISADNHGVLESTLFIRANVAKEGQSAPSSEVQMTIGYFENYVPYKYAIVNGKQVEIKEYKVATKLCSDMCKATQYFTFPVDNAVLLKAAGSEFVFDLRPDRSNHKLTFSIPGQYIEAQMNGYKVNALPAVALGVPTPKAAPKQDASAIKMSQDLYAKASDAEKEQFTDWAFKNRKSINASLDAEGKILPMLEYWYEKADADEKAEILTWILAQ